MVLCNSIKSKTQCTQYGLMAIGAAAITTKTVALGCALFQNFSLVKNPRALANVNPFGKYTGPVVLGGLCLSGLVLGGCVLADAYRAWKARPTVTEVPACTQTASATAPAADEE